jgi:benzil reductase ((S)-benzoin forming)
MTDLLNPEPRELAWITGASKGLGRELCLQLLNQGWKVFGISRSHTISHQNFTPIFCDLSLPGDLAAVKFEAFNCKQLLLINNAGSLGEIGPVGSITDEEIIQTISLNLTAAAVLSNKFLKQTQSLDCSKTIVNISSGAGRNAYDGWATYCSTKAGLDMFSMSVAKELNLNGISATRIFSIAPGVIDTQMQEEIRSKSVDEFSSVERFKLMHQNNQLSTPESIAQKLLSFIAQRDRFSEVCLDVRNLDL